MATVLNVTVKTQTQSVRGGYQWHTSRKMPLGSTNALTSLNRSNGGLLALPWEEPNTKNHTTNTVGCREGQPTCKCAGQYKSQDDRLTPPSEHTVLIMC